MTLRPSSPPFPPHEAPTEGEGAHAGPKVNTFQLDNGMEVVVIPDHRAPVVTHMVWYRNGSADDPRGKSGIAHFLEHLMFKGTHKHKPGDFSHLVAELGGQENAFTSYDFTAYFQRIATRAPRRDDGIRSRPHDQPHAVGRGGAARARRGDGRAAHAHGVRPRRPARRGAERGAVHPPCLWRADHRLEPRDRNPEPRRTRWIITGVFIRPETPFSWWPATSNGTRWKSSRAKPTARSLRAENRRAAIGRASPNPARNAS